MEDYINISTLNDFVFCPYSIYLHNVYMESDESTYHALPQTQGKLAHQAIDNKTSSNRTNDILSLPVYSETWKLMGKIDVYKQKEKKLIERKYQIKTIYRGQIYQLWAQMFCLQEMGYEVDSLAFYETSTNKTHPISLPTICDTEELKWFIEKYRMYDPLNTSINLNPSKCNHCIYCSLCDKTFKDNVYT